MWNDVERCGTMWNDVERWTSVSKPCGAASCSSTMSTAARQTISTPNVSNNTAIRVRSPICVRPRNARASESIHPRAMSLSVKSLIFPREEEDAPDEDELDDSPGEDEFEGAPDECEFEDPPDEDECEDSSGGSRAPSTTHSPPTNRMGGGRCTQKHS